MLGTTKLRGKLASPINLKHHNAGMFQRKRVVKCTIDYKLKCAVKLFKIIAQIN